MINRLSNSFDNIKALEGDYNLLADQEFKDTKIVIVASKFNSFIVDHLIKGAVETLLLHGMQESNIELISVPGAMELPLAVQNILQRPEVIGVVALGAVIRGATAHFEYVAGECIRGLSKLSLEFNKPVGCGVLTTENIEQAIERAGSKAGNKGSEAALTVLNMLSLINKIHHNNYKSSKKTNPIDNPEVVV